ncbi:MAG: DUF892 family protein [Thermodesulfobacteriales bacterium]|nr:MAG: DUF892 family protein [Thermodesulfobacteriales bacterium]
MYYVERENVKALTRILRETTDQEIILAIEALLSKCFENKKRIKKIFKDLEIKPRVKKSRGIDGIIDE